MNNIDIWLLNVQEHAAQILRKLIDNAASSVTVKYRHHLHKLFELHEVLSVCLADDSWTQQELVNYLATLSEENIFCEKYFGKTVFDKFPFKKRLVGVFLERKAYRCLAILAEIIPQDIHSSLCSELAAQIHLNINALWPLNLLLALINDRNRIFSEASMVKLLKQMGGHLLEAEDVSGFCHLIENFTEASELDESGLLKIVLGTLLDCSDRRKVINLLHLSHAILFKLKKHPVFFSKQADLLIRSKIIQVLMKWLHGVAAESYYTLKLLNMGKEAKVVLPMKLLLSELEILLGSDNFALTCSFYRDSPLLIANILEGYVLKANFRKNVNVMQHPEIILVQAHLSGERVEKDAALTLTLKLADNEAYQSMLVAVIYKTFGCRVQLPIDKMKNNFIHCKIDYSPIIEQSSPSVGDKKKIAELEAEVEEVAKQLRESGALRDKAIAKAEVAAFAAKAYESQWDALKKELERQNQEMEAQSFHEEEWIAKVNKLTAEHEMRAQDLHAEIGRLNGEIRTHLTSLAQLQETDGQRQVLMERLQDELSSSKHELQLEQSKNTSLIKDMKNKLQLDRLKLQHELDAVQAAHKQATLELQAAQAEVYRFSQAESLAKAEIARLKSQLVVKDELLLKHQAAFDRLFAASHDEKKPNRHNNIDKAILDILNLEDTLSLDFEPNNPASCQQDF